MSLFNFTPFMYIFTHRCQANFYDFSNYGCRPCACDAAGSLNNNPSCEVNTGVCRCKENVEGQNCDRGEMLDEKKKKRKTKKEIDCGEGVRKSLSCCC